MKKILLLSACALLFGLYVSSCGSPVSTNSISDVPQDNAQVPVELTALFDPNSPDMDMDYGIDNDVNNDLSGDTIAIPGAVASSGSRDLIAPDAITYTSDDKMLKLTWARSETVNGKGVLFGVLRLKKDSSKEARIYYTNDGSPVTNASPYFTAKNYGYTNDKLWQKYYFVLPEAQQVAVDAVHNKFFFIIEYKFSPTVSYLSQKGYTYRVASTTGQQVIVDEGVAKPRLVTYQLGQTVLGTRHNVIENAKIEKKVDEATGAISYVYSGHVQVKYEDPNAVVKVEYQLNTNYWTWADAYGQVYKMVPTTKLTNVLDFYPNGYKKAGSDELNPSLYGVKDYYFETTLAAIPLYMQFISIDKNKTGTWMDKNRCRRHWINSSANPITVFPAYYSSYSLK